MGAQSAVILRQVRKAFPLPGGLGLEVLATASQPPILSFIVRHLLEERHARFPERSKFGPPIRLPTVSVALETCCKVSDGWA